MSSEAIAKIEQDPGIPDKVKELAPLFENSAYTTASRLQLDLGIPDKEAEGIMPAIEQHTHFSNGFIKMGEPGALGRRQTFPVPATWHRRYHRTDQPGLSCHHRCRKI